jgi:hypothetical protein
VCLFVSVPLNHIPSSGFLKFLSLHVENCILDFFFFPPSLKDINKHVESIC